MTFINTVRAERIKSWLFFCVIFCVSLNGSEAQHRRFTRGSCCEPLEIGLKANGVNATCDFNGATKDCFSSSLPEGTHVKLGCLYSWLPLSREQYGIQNEATCVGGRWEPYTVLKSFSCRLECGTTPLLSPNLIGSTLTDREQWPWQATLFDMRRKPPLFICGASLTSALHILTAAHCVEDKRPQDVQVVLSAVSSKYRENVYEKEARILKIKYIDAHPDYKGKDEGSFVADIAILTLEEYQTFSGYAIPICLPPPNWPSYPPLRNEGDVVGFGVSSYEDLAATVPSKRLRHIRMPKTSPRNCGHPKFDWVNQICIGDPQGSSGTCRGDSGGSFSIQMNFDYDSNSPNVKRYIEGIVSAGKQDCTGSSVFTKVQPYTLWVRQIQDSKLGDYFNSLASSVEIGTCEVPEVSTSTTSVRPTTTTSTTPPPPEPCDDSDENACPASIEDLVAKIIGRINSFRRLHNAAPLRKSRTLGRIAQRYAEEAVLSGRKLETRSDTKYGQTLFEFNFQSGNVTRYQITETSVDQWYETKASYNPVAPKSTSFTQMVWKRTERVGCGVRSLDRRTVIFCLYDPSGNIIYWEANDPYREFKVNVQA